MKIILFNKNVSEINRVIITEEKFKQIYISFGYVEINY